MNAIKEFRSFYQLREKEPDVATLLYQKRGNVGGPWMFSRFILFPTKTSFAKYILENDQDYYSLREASTRLTSPSPLKYLNYTKFADALIKDWGWRIVFPLGDGRVVFTEFYGRSM